MTYGPLRRGHGQTYRDLILTHLVEYLQAKTTSFDVLMLVGGPFGDDAPLMIRIVKSRGVRAVHQQPSAAGAQSYPHVHRLSILRTAASGG
jgi:hypothetical protein